MTVCTLREVVPKRNPPAEQIAVTSIRTTRSLLEAFRAVADSHHRTVSQELRHVMAEAVRAAEEPERAA